MAPDVAPYRGHVSEGPWSDYRQPKTYNERLEPAWKVSELHEDGVHYLLDTLTMEDKDNNQIVWCQYGPAANPGYIINQDGIVEIGMEWVDADLIKEKLHTLLSETAQSSKSEGNISADTSGDTSSNIGIGNSHWFHDFCIVVTVVVYLYAWSTASPV
eukprot:TRINITY_DN6639_c0_g1_i1.p1 TRINITY_DN6639_c0_g1~~TRINITY_DN6639_c0_g1_i1.p1  ORF type:complete len:158 (-),score=18.05 TRINITY_DN6639_c0_g1_i1:93-566(-)